MLFENLGMFICIIGALIGFISVALIIIFIFEESRGIKLEGFNSYIGLTNLVYLAALFILGFQWLTNPECAELAQGLLMAFCIAWLLCAVLTLVYSCIIRKDSIRERIPHCILKILLTIITFWLVS